MSRPTSNLYTSVVSESCPPSLRTGGMWIAEREGGRETYTRGKRRRGREFTAPSSHVFGRK